MGWRGPEFDGDFPSLGWGLLDWFEAFLRVPNGPRWGEPLRLTDEQARFVVRFYALGLHGGRVYRRGALRRAKGWGKSPLLAAMAIGELAGPVVFDGWDAAGEPVGRPQPTPWVQIAAVSEDQAGNTYSHAYEMLREGRAADELGIDLGLTRVFLRGRPGRIEAVTSSAGSREGQPVTFAVLDETHLWLRENGGHRLAATIRRNAAKLNGGTVESTNAHRVGQGSVSEATLEAADRGVKGLLYDAVEAPPVADMADRAELRAALAVAYGDSVWVDLDRLVDEVQDPATSTVDARRFYLNQLTSDDDSWVDPVSWQACGSNARLADGDVVTLGFDGSVSEDWTGLVACRVPDGLLEPLGVWRRPPGRDEWTVPRGEVDAAVAAAMERFTVRQMVADPSHWRTELERWSAEWDVVVAFEPWRTRQMAQALDRFHTAVVTGQLRHTGHADLTAHVLHAVRRDSRGGVQIDKPSPGQKIDLAVAAVLAYEARSWALREPEVEPAAPAFITLDDL